MLLHAIIGVGRTSPSPPPTTARILTDATFDRRHVPVLELSAQRSDRGYGVAPRPFRCRFRVGRRWQVWPGLLCHGNRDGLRYSLPGFGGSRRRRNGDCFARRERTDRTVDGRGTRQQRGSCGRSDDTGRSYRRRGLGRRNRLSIAFRCGCHTLYVDCRHGCGSGSRPSRVANDRPGHRSGHGYIRHRRQRRRRPHEIHRCAHRSDRAERRQRRYQQLRPIAISRQVPAERESSQRLRRWPVRSQSQDRCKVGVEGGIVECVERGHHDFPAS